MDDLVDPGHAAFRGLLRFVGPLLAIVGLAFVVVGMVSFFSAFGGQGPPRLFWCCFVGAPLLAAGSGITKFAYMGAVARYIASETMPVGKDAANYLVDGTRDSIRDVATAIGEGIAAVQTTSTIICPRCGDANDAGANFCSQCGAPLATSRRCSKCGKSNDVDARFCDHCGAAVV